MNSCSVLSSSACVVDNLYSPRIEFVGLKMFILNLKFCELRVHDPRLSCWEVRYDELELLQTCFEQNFMSGTFIFQNHKIKSSSVMKYTHQSHLHGSKKETIYLHAAASFWALPNFLTFVSFFSYSHDRESLTHHLHMLKLPHQKDSISIPSTHSYPLSCTILHKVSPKILSNKGMSYVLKKKGAHEGPWKKNMDTWRSMQKK